jgi:hypothetical protein
MNRRSFDCLVDGVQKVLVDGVSSGAGKYTIDVEKQVLITVWTLANQESYM